MKKSNRRRKSLKLRVETLRRLDVSSLRKVAGGGSDGLCPVVVDDGTITRTTLWSIYDACMP